MSGIYKAFLEHQHALRQVVGRYFRRQEDIDDLVQDTFVRAFSAEMKEEIRAPKAFLLHVAKNLALSEVKKKVNSITDFMEDSGGPEVYSNTSQATAEDEVDAKRKLRIFSEAVAQLPHEYRQVLIMRKMEGVKFKTIAQRLGLSLSTVEKRVAVAVVMCATYIRDQGCDPAEFGAADMLTSGPVNASKRAARVAGRKPGQRRVSVAARQGNSDDR